MAQNVGDTTKNVTSAKIADVIRHIALSRHGERGAINAMPLDLRGGSNGVTDLTRFHCRVDS